MRARVKIGTGATIRVDGVEREFRGQVRFVSSEAEFTPYYSLTAADRSKLSFRRRGGVRRRRRPPRCPPALPLDVSLELGAP